MQNLLNSEQMRSADAFTLTSRQISSIELMESASLAFVKAFIEEVNDKEASIAILCGTGNNGADGLAIARILKDQGYTGVNVYLIAFSSRETEEYRVNLEHLQDLWFQLSTVTAAGQLCELKEQVIIDAVLGSGLNKPLSGPYLELAEVVNGLNRRVIAVDVPTGFPSEGVVNKDSTCLKADLVICFQRPKINFFFPESLTALKRFCVVNIGLDEEFIAQQNSPYRLTDDFSIQQLIKPRAPFSHKGSYGHALIIAGQVKTMGAALLSAKACLYGGAGLTTLSIPTAGLTALNAALPEVMYLERESIVTELKEFKAIAIGPGIGTAEESVLLVKELMKQGIPLIVDADALNIIGKKKELLKQLPEGSVLTPHMKEFDVLFGAHHSWWERLQTAREKAKQMKCVIVLKNQYTFVVDQEGLVSINSTGNPAMAQGGMGDILTGLIASFQAQGYPADQAALIACYLHGLSGDELAKKRVNITASEVAVNIPETLKVLIKQSRP